MTAVGADEAGEGAGREAETETPGRAFGVRLDCSREPRVGVGLRRGRLDRAACVATSEPTDDGAGFIVAAVCEKAGAA